MSVNPRRGRGINSRDLLGFGLAMKPMALTLTSDWTPGLGAKGVGQKQKI